MDFRLLLPVDSPLICLPETSRCSRSQRGLRTTPATDTNEGASCGPRQAYKDWGEHRHCFLNESSKEQGRAPPAPIRPSTPSQFGSQCWAFSGVQHPYQEEHGLLSSSLIYMLYFATMLLVICYNFLCFQPRISKQLKGPDFPSSFCSEDHTSITIEKENQKNREITQLQIQLRAQKNTQWLSMINKASSWWENSAPFWKAVLLKYHPIDTFFKWPLK